MKARETFEGLPCLHHVVQSLLILILEILQQPLVFILFNLQLGFQKVQSFQQLPAHVLAISELANSSVVRRLESVELGVEILPLPLELLHLLLSLVCSLCPPSGRPPSLLALH